MATSVISEGELIFMAEGSHREEENTRRVTAFLAGIRIYEIDPETAAVYGGLKAGLYTRFGPKERAKRRHTSITQLGFSDNDLWIASLAIRNGLILVSDDADFERMREVHRFDLTTWVAAQHS